MKTQKILPLFFLVLVSCGPGSDPLSGNGICGNYPAAATSSYRLPFAVGTTHELGQGNCSGFTHFGEGRYAYDFGMDIGTTIVAARAGTVIEVVQDGVDGNGCASTTNMVKIRHSDNTVARYVHLTQNGSLVTVGAAVTQGQSIARSGNTGCSTGPHLHFQVDKSSTDYESVPVSFSNTAVEMNGLQAGTRYTAQ